MFKRWAIDITNGFDKNNPVCYVAIGYDGSIMWGMNIIGTIDVLPGEILGFVSQDDDFTEKWCMEHQDIVQEILSRN